MCAVCAQGQIVNRQNRLRSPFPDPRTAEWIGGKRTFISLGDWADHGDHSITIFILLEQLRQGAEKEGAK